MRRPRQAIFLLFFGLALLEALTDGRWPRVLFWLAMTAILGILDLWDHRKQAHGGAA